MTTISWFDSPTTVDAALANADRARAAGLHRYWNPQIAVTDPMVVLGIVAREIPDIGLGTSVVAMQSTFAKNLAIQSRTINQASGGRFTLGLGTSHQPAMELRHGLKWDRPYTHMVQYLDSLLPLLSDQEVSSAGEFVTTHAEIDVPGPTPEVMLAALGPKMLKLAADRTAGTITWMTGPKTIASHIRPCIGEAHIAAGVPVWVTDDPVGAREKAAVNLAIYGQLPSYRAMLDREGMAGPGEMVLAGDLDTIRAGLEEYRDAGVDEVALNVLGSGDAVEGAWELVESMGGSL
ncbi:MAG: TIGR03564 family F420-dependent LLM class oxidoreductase [Acidimicrobiaceae bacterium]|nr:TIGR03564 family F420-dependent LLM class oxidoreductase [Acidimicrobiaceae bacterium]